MSSFHGDLPRRAPTGVARTCCRPRIDPELVEEALLPGCRDQKRAAVRDTLDPLTCEREVEKGRAEEAGQMGTPLAPVQARPTEDAALGYRAQTHSDLAQERVARTRHLATVLVQHDIRPFDQGIGDADGDATRHMIVAGPGVAERLAAPPAFPMTCRSVLRDDHQPLEHPADER